MLNVGMTELLVFGIIALLVLGPEKLPEAARFAGKWYGQIKRMISNVQNDIDRELKLSELRQEMQSEMNRIHELEQQMQLQMQQLQQDIIFANEQDAQALKAEEVLPKTVQYQLHIQQPHTLVFLKKPNLTFTQHHHPTAQTLQNTSEVS